MFKIKIDIQQSLNNNQIELKQQQLEDSIQEPRNLKKKNQPLLKSQLKKISIQIYFVMQLKNNQEEVEKIALQ